MDDGADLVSLLHSDRKGAATGIIGSTEEDDHGYRLKSLAASKLLKFQSGGKRRLQSTSLTTYGTGQSTLDGILRATSRLFAGSTFVVCGYGWCGKGL